jgi:hypothetical protein
LVQYLIGGDAVDAGLPCVPVERIEVDKTAGTVENTAIPLYAGTVTLRL